MCRPAKRNALSRDHLTQLLAAVTEVGDSDAAGLVIAAEGPVFSAGHDFADVAGRPVTEVRSLLQLCTELLQTLHDVPQVVLARVHALATAAGCQLVASCDLAVAAESAGFAAPGGKGGWFCHTPMVAIAPRHRPQAGHGAGADRRRHRRGDRAGVGPGQPGGARRRARRGRRRPHGPGHPRLPGEQGLG